MILLRRFFAAALLLFAAALPAHAQFPTQATYAGAASGSASAQAITLSNMVALSDIQGVPITWVPSAANTGAVTLAINSGSTIAIQRPTRSGLAALSGSELQSGQPVMTMYNGTVHVLLSATGAGPSQAQCGATGLKIVNSSGTPNSIINVTAGSATIGNTSNSLAVIRSSVSVTINITTGTSSSTAGGMDGEGPGTSSWIYIWLIDNGAAPAGLASAASGNGLTPTLPTGYSYMCRVGAMRVDGSGNLLRQLQLGADTQYVVTAASNTTVLPVITSSFSTYWTSNAIGAFVPPTATRIRVSSEIELALGWNGVNSSTSSADAGVASNSSYGDPLASGRPPCSFHSNWTAGTGFGATDTKSSAQICDLVLESTNIFTGSATATTGTGGTASVTATLSTVGWRDDVNAN